MEKMEGDETMLLTARLAVGLNVTGASWGRFGVETEANERAGPRKEAIEVEAVKELDDMK